MKNSKPAVLVLLLMASVFTFYQCTNNEDIFQGFDLEDTFSNLQEVHDSLTRNDTITFTMTDPEIDNTFEGPQGIRLVFPAGSCTSGSTSVVAPLTVKLIEIFKRGDMIRHNIQTFAGEDPLVSGGMFWLEVTDANGTVLAFDGAQAILPYQTDAVGYENSMEYFTGTTQIAPSGPVISWGTAQSELSFDDTAGTNGEFTIWNIMGGWSNCDAFYDLITDGATQFSVRVPNVIDYSNTQVFFALDNFTTVVSLNTVNADALATYAESIPVGATGKIIAISLIEGQLQMASQDVTIAGDETFDLSVQPATIAELETLLASIN